MKLVLLSSILLLLAGCGGSGGDATETGTVAVKCVNVSNDGTANCTNAAMAGITASRGDVSRSQAMWISGTFTNGTAKPFTGSRVAIMSTGCNGESNWVLGSSNFTLQPGESLFPTHSIQCPSMPLGQSEISFVIYDGQERTVCVHPPGQVCTSPQPGVISCTPADICEVVRDGAEVDRGTAAYTVVN